MPSTIEYLWMFTLTGLSGIASPYVQAALGRIHKANQIEGRLIQGKQSAADSLQSQAQQLESILDPHRPVLRIIAI
jgi:hypothetical protein